MLRLLRAPANKMQNVPLVSPYLHPSRIPPVLATLIWMQAFLGVFPPTDGLSLSRV